MTTKPTELVAHFIEKVRFEDLPERAIHYVVDAITDYVAVTFAGSVEPLAHHLLSVLTDGRDGGPAYLIGTEKRAGWAEAALYNGAAGHAIDYDDYTHPAYSHPSVHIVPVLFSLGQYAAVSGRTLITAYALGLEMEGKLGRAMNTSHFAKGWHPTCTFGTLGACVAGTKVLGLDATGIKNALGIAASSASGLRANFGTMTKPLHAGLAAQRGVLAGLLAQKGFTAVEDILEHPLGFLKVFAGKDEPKQDVFLQLGNPFEIDTPYGLGLKAYPSCAGTHAAIEAAQDIRKEIKVEEIERVVVGINEMSPTVLAYHNPQTPLEARFSGEFCVAAALAGKELNRATFSEAVLNEPQVKQLIPKITVEVDERVRYNSEHGSVVTVILTSGKKIERLIELPKGKPGRWMSRQDLWNKFLDCSEAVLGRERASAAFEALQGIERVNSIEEIIRTLQLVNK